MAKTSKPKRRRIRWSDNDRCWGPFTYSRDTRGYRPFAIVLGSGDCEDGPAQCRLRISAFGHTLIVALPGIVRPYREKVIAVGWDKATIERLGRDWYWNTDEREFGFSVSEGFLRVLYGRQSLDSSTEKSWGYFLPWRQWRHVRHSFYGLDGEHFWTEAKRAKGAPFNFDDWRAAQATCPSRSFAFKDFDGEALTVDTRIEEREWRCGEGWFKWLSLIRRPRIRRYLCLDFSGETGTRKGSWKGGTIGASIDIHQGELHESAFRRYCAENNMTFAGVALTVVKSGLS